MSLSHQTLHARTLEACQYLKFDELPSLLSSITEPVPLSVFEPTSTDRYGWNYGHWLVSYCPASPHFSLTLPILKLLLEKIPDLPSHPDSGSYTLVHYACMHSELDVIQCLFEHSNEEFLRVTEEGKGVVDLSYAVRHMSGERDEVTEWIHKKFVSIGGNPKRPLFRVDDPTTTTSSTAPNPHTFPFPRHVTPNTSFTFIPIIPATPSTCALKQATIDRSVKLNQKKLQQYVKEFPPNWSIIHTPERNRNFLFIAPDGYEFSSIKKAKQHLSSNLPPLPQSSEPWYSPDFHRPIASATNQQQPSQNLDDLSLPQSSLLVPIPSPVPPQMSLSVGSRVHAAFGSGPDYYPGTISAVGVNGL
ncbi:hypothetical protein TrLO_g9387 [Triparma laevis f. longispina]|nr:hypothetical protein TrLO_g9387 [Triparma laevis f. longispina]